MLPTPEQDLAVAQIVCRCRTCLPMDLIHCMMHLQNREQVTTEPTLQSVMLHSTLSHCRLLGDARV